MRARRGYRIGSAVMAVMALVCVPLAGTATGVIFAAIGGIVGTLVGIPLLGRAARRDARGRTAGKETTVLVPFAVIVGMLLLPRVFDVIGMSLGWALVGCASAFIAAATYVTSRSDEIFGSSG